MLVVVALCSYALTAPADHSAAHGERIRMKAYEQHRVAHETKLAAQYESAVALYDAYLALADEPVERRARAAFFRAEALWDLGRWRAAAEGYRAALELDDQQEDWSSHAAYDRVLAWEKVVNGVGASEVDASGVLTGPPARGFHCGLGVHGVTQKTPPIRDEEIELLSAAESFVQSKERHSPLSDDERATVIAVLYKRAYILATHDDTSAIADAQAFIDKGPRSTSSDDLDFSMLALQAVSGDADSLERAIERIKRRYGDDLNARRAIGVALDELHRRAP